MILALILYFSLLTILACWASKNVKTTSDFIIGDRSLNFWLTALAAHASDMSSWLFMGYPALIYATGLFNAWVAIGLILCMWLNWTFLAKKLRVLTGEWNCATLSSFLHKKYEDRSGNLQLLSAIFCFLFYAVYICSGLTGIGILGESLFHMNYMTGVIAGACIIVLYVILGGFVTLAWVDFAQGIFLLGVICITPFIVMSQNGGYETFQTVLTEKPDFLKFLPTSWADAAAIFAMVFGWGLGYFGQPHIITKFMGIKNPKEISKSRDLGMVWMVLSLAGATLVGLVSVQYFTTGIHDSEMIFIEMIKGSFRPFIAGFILCAVLAATLNVMSSQLLILGSIVIEDFVKVVAKREYTTQELLKISRVVIIITALFAVCIALAKLGTIYNLVHYAWSGLGAAFGPLVLVSLYSKTANKYGAFAAILTGGTVSAVVPFLNYLMPFKIEPLIMGCVLSFLSIYIVSYLTTPRHSFELK